MNQLLVKKHTRTQTPPLNSGDRLTRFEFERRYVAEPNKKAELIEGVVYVSSPVYLPHARPHSYLTGLVSQYVMRTTGLDIADNLSVRLDPDNEVQPDICVWFSAEEPMHNPENKYFEGAPAFVFEVAASSAGYDLHDKLKAYRRNEVREYVVLSVYEQSVHWFVLDAGEFKRIAADEDGIFRSQLLPGFWFDAKGFWEKNWQKVLGTLDEGMESAEYRTFREQLAQ